MAKKLHNCFKCFFYLAAPVFFMISGATLIDYPERYDIKTFFKKRLLKPLYPIYALWQ